MEEQHEHPAVEEQPKLEIDGEGEAAAAAAAQASAAMDLGQLAALEIPQLVDYSAQAGPTDLMPAITNLIMQITQHLSNPSGNPQLALTFQPLVNMALNMQLSASVPDMSAMYNLSALGAGQMQFDPQMLIAGVAAAGGGDADGGGQQPAQRRKGGGGRRKQQVQQQYSEEEEMEGEDDDDADWSWKHKSSGRGSSARPQRQRKKSKLLQEYLTDDEEEGAAGGAGYGRRAPEY
ncbi:hypothetical protein ACK3TF_001638 [Chlorella vulgaris]